MNFEINIGLNKIHLFATHARSISNGDQLATLLKIFKEKFPESEGYKISASCTSGLSQELNINADNISEQVSEFFNNTIK